MMRDRVNWAEYYQKIAGREARPLLLDALERFDDAPQHTRTAIDLGSGDGTESALLLEHGWRVLAIDSAAAAMERLAARVPAKARARLQTQVAAFEDVDLPAADLIYAGYSIPFCAPEHFDALWVKIARRIRTGGRFAGQLFGVNDSWAIHDDMSFHTKAQARGLFEGFKIESFHEQDEDGQATSGPKHWHVFSVIARKG